VDAKETGDIGAAAPGGQHAENFGSLMRHVQATHQKRTLIHPLLDRYKRMLHRLATPVEDAGAL
jgi:hypothetical protein